MVAEVRVRAIVLAAVSGLLCAAPPAGAAGAGADAAASLAQLGFAARHPQLAAHDPSDDLAAQPAGAEYLGETVAGGPEADPGTLLVSSAPLRARDPGGQLVPVDLTLAQRAGAFVPLAAPISLALGSGASAVIALGRTAASSVVLRPLDEGTPRNPPGELAGKLLFTGTHADTNTLLSPQVDGATLLQELGSAEAPTRFAYALELPAGAASRLERNGLTVTGADGTVLARALPPQAMDANATPVRAMWERDGENRYALVLAPPAAGTPARAFPVVATTSFTSSYDWQSDPGQTGFGGWGTVETDPPPPVAPGPYFRSHFGDSSRGPGLELEPIGGRVYDNGDHTRVDGGPVVVDQFGPPGTTTIKRATFSHVDFLDDSEGIVMRMAVYGSGGYGNAVDLAPPEFPNGTPVTGFSTTIDVPATERGTSAQIWMYSVCPDSPPGSGNFSCRFVASPSRSFGRIGAVSFTLADYEAPGADLSGDLPATGGRWSRGRGSAAVAVAGSDPGSGVRSESLTVKSEGQPSKTLATHQAACDPTHSTPALGFGICPETDDLAATVALGDLPQGRSTFTATVRDLSGRTTARTFAALIDRAAPSATVSGQLTRLGASWLALNRPVALAIHARDARSGVANVELYASHAGAGRSLLAAAPAPCDLAAKAPGAACPRDRISTLTIDPASIPDGTTRFDVVTIDGAGNRSAPRDVRSLRLDRTSPAKPRPAGRRRGATATFRWAAVADERPGAGLRGYDYRVRATSGRFGSWSSTRSTTITRHGLRPALGYETQVRSCDRVGNCSSASSATVARAASVSRPARKRPRRNPTAVRDHDEAERFRPLLFFDHAEDWHPVTVDSYFGRVPVKQCRGSRCMRVRKAADLVTNARRLGDPESQYLDAPGDVNRPPHYANRDKGLRSGYYYSLARTPSYRYYNYWTFFTYNNAPYSDFPAGIRIKFDKTIRILGFRKRFKVNTFVNFGLFDRHESDWEGMVIGVPTGSQAPQHPHFVAFSEHAGTFRYLFSVLQCGDREVHACGGTDARVRGYVAHSTHATYPRACRATDQGIGKPSVAKVTARALKNILSQLVKHPRAGLQAVGVGLRKTLTEYLYRNHYCVQSNQHTIGPVTINLPEFGFDGAERWSENSSRRALNKLPYNRNRSNTWTYWSGNWNTLHERPGHDPGAKVPDVASPGKQPRDIDPTDGHKYKCSPRDDFSNKPPETLVDIVSCFRAPFLKRAAPATLDPVCADWMGALADAVVCDPATLRQAMRNGTIDRAGGVAIGGGVSDVAASTAALSQSLGDPLAPGQSIVFDGATPATTQALVRVADGSQTTAFLFSRVGLEAGGRSVVSATTDVLGEPAATLFAPDGSSVIGTPVTDPAVNGTPADPVQVGGGTPGSAGPRVASARARLVNHTVQVTFRALGATSVIVDVVDAAGSTIASRSVSGSSAGQRRVVIPVGTQVPATARLTPASAVATGTPVETPVAP